MSDRRSAQGHRAQPEEGDVCASRRVLLPARRQVGGGGEEGELGADARPSRDPELQSDAAFGAVVTRVWLPAPRCPAHGGLASGPGKAEQPSAGLRGQVSRRRTSRRGSGGGGDCKDRPRSNGIQRGTSGQKYQHGKCPKGK